MRQSATASRSPFRTRWARRPDTGGLPRPLIIFQRQYSHNISLRIVFVDSRIGKDRLILDEYGVPNAVVWAQCSRSGLQTTSPPAGRRPGLVGACNTHGDACGNADICRTVWRLLIAEHAWQRAYPADTVLASIPRVAM